MAKTPAKRPASSAIAELDLNNLPEHMREDIGKGTENLRQSDLEVPRIKLMQGLSKELQEHDDLRIGHFLHTSVAQSLGDRFLATPLYLDIRYILWRPLEDGGGILARADDGVHWKPANREFTVKLDKKDGGHRVTWTTAETVAASGLDQWGTMNPNDEDSPPAATLMYNYLLGFPDRPDLPPAVLSLQRTSIRPARKFNTKLKTIRAPMFGLVVEFTSIDDHNPAGQDFKNVAMRVAGQINDTNLYEQYKEVNRQFTEAGLNIKDLESAQGEAVGTDDREDDEKVEKRAKGKY